MPEKYQKNRNNQRNPAQSKPFAVVLLRLNTVIQRSSQKNQIASTRREPSMLPTNGNRTDTERP
jgi:hypothetical protein